MSVSTKPPSGFRDFLGDQAFRRRQLIQKISEIYSQFGFEEIETPALENLNVLLGSGGQENEKLLFRVLKRKEKLEKALFSQNQDELADLGLRFDLTVPLCRLVAQYQNEIKLPWKVFHIAPVWRAERPQRGRFREFLQCDVDVVGSEGIGAELEVLQAVSCVFESFGIDDLKLHLNHRLFLEGIAKELKIEDRLDEFAIILDKKDKLKPEQLRVELQQLFENQEFPKFLDDLIEGECSLEDFKKFSDEAYEQIFTLKEVARRIPLPVQEICFDPSLVRGMGYYTGSVFELRSEKDSLSLGGGGRYDHLIGRFSKKSISAVGMSIGFERLLMLLNEKASNVFAESKLESRLFVTVLDENRRADCLKLAREVRQSGFEVDVFADSAKPQKQLKYASAKAYRWVLIVGSQELDDREYSLKDFKTGEEIKIKHGQIAEHLRQCF